MPDLSDIPIIDHHAHALWRAAGPLTIEAFRSCFTESADPIVQARDVPETLVWLWGLRELAGYLGCEPTPAAVLAARNAVPLAQLANGLWRDQNCELLVIDPGFRAAGSYTPGEMRASFEPRVELLLRLETFAEELIGQHATFPQMLEAFVARIEGARVAGYVGLKSIVAYRTGLDIGTPSREEAARAYASAREHAQREGTIRLAHKPLNDLLLRTALGIAASQELPVQLHTGFGDPDIDLRTANPLHLRPLLADQQLRGVPFVLLHAGYPYVRELGYLAAMYPNVFMDISLAIPFVTTEIPRMIHETLALTPLTKVLYSSDGFSIPEIFWLAHRWGRRALQQVLDEIVRAGALTEVQARRAGELILNGNARRVYGLP
jgi:hypothetical protein